MTLIRPFVPAPQSFEDLIEALAERGIRIHHRTPMSPDISHPFLLKGIARRWWGAWSVCHSPNLQWSWISENMVDITDIEIHTILTYNRTISWPQLKTLLERPGIDARYATRNPIMPFSYILEHPEVGWGAFDILCREDYTHENAVLFSRMKGKHLVPPGEFTYDELRRNPRRALVYHRATGLMSHHPIERILQDINDGINLCAWNVGRACKHPDFRPEMMDIYPNITWKWYPMLSKSMTKEDMLRIFDLPCSKTLLARIAFWSHPSITLDMIGTVEPSRIDGLLRNPNLACPERGRTAWDFILENAEKFHNTLLSRVDRNRSEEIVKRRIEAATVIQRWYRCVTIFDLTFPRAEKKFRLAMEEMYQ